jgi:4-aminobutyrate aminotransferase-like enzyme
MAAGMAVMDVIEHDGLVANAQSVGQYLRAGLSQLATRHALIGDVRGAGLFIGVELVTDRTAKTPATAQTVRIVNGLRERGVLLSSTGEHANTLKIRPPLVFSEANADLLIGTLDEVLTAM